LRGRFGMYLPPVLEALGLAEVHARSLTLTTGVGRSPRTAPDALVRLLLASLGFRSTAE